MEVDIKNCNNLDTAKISIGEGRLNDIGTGQLEIVSILKPQFSLHAVCVL